MLLKGIKTKEKLIETFLLACAAVSVLTSIGILWVLFTESMIFFRHVSIVEFLTGTEWTPLFAEKKFGILPLVSGTVLTSLIAIAVALPLGLTIAIYINEYAPKSFRRIVKPVLEILAVVPTVVYGYFALMVVTPFLQKWIPGMSGFNALSPGIVMGIMIIPFISSLSDDALFQTSFKVLLPAASSGIIMSVILAISRAVGETMIVAIAAGQQPRLTANPLVPIETITTFIVQVSLGDVVQGSLEYQTIFAAGIALFVLTFALNNLSFWMKKRLQEKYE